jgi:hypothetical protein
MMSKKVTFAELEQLLLGLGLYPNLAYGQMIVHLYL